MADHVLPSGYTARIDSEGLSSIKLGATEIAVGPLQLVNGGWFYGDISIPTPYIPTIASKQISGSNVVHRYTNALNAVAIYRYQVVGNNIHIRAEVKNLSLVTIEKPAFISPRILFDDVQDARDASGGLFHFRDIMGSSQDNRYPRPNIPSGGVYFMALAASGTPINFCIWSEDDPFDESMVASDGISGLPGQFVIMCCFRPILPGQTCVYNFAYCISDSTDWQVLMAGYKAKVRSARPRAFTPDFRPIAQFASINPAYVRVDNPYGYNDGGGSVLERRLDLEAGAQATVDWLLPGMNAANYQSVICWQPQGINERTPELLYRPDFHVWPAVTLANIPLLVDGFGDDDRKIGLLARPSTIITSEAYAYETIAYQSANLVDLLAHFTWAIDQGFSGWYFDSFPGNSFDHRTLAAIRAHLGVNEQIFTEAFSIASLPLAGVYGTLHYTGGNFVHDTFFEIARFIYPDVPWMLHYFGAEPPGGKHDIYEYMLSNGLIPLVQDFEVSTEADYGVLGPLVEQYI